jgi:phosphatidate cytidylyltransferase
MLRTRVLTACVLGLILLAGLFLTPPWAASAAFGVVFAIGAWEWAGFGGLAGALGRIVYTAGIVLLLLLAWRETQNPRYLLLLLTAACLWWAVAFAWVCIAPNRQSRALTLLCGVFVLVPSCIALARLLAVVRGFARGPEAVLCLVLLVVASDIGAYFAGRRFGRLKLAPQVSPSKTWEGAAGGLVFVALVSWVGARVFGLPALATVCFGCAIGLISIVGDLTESMFKRSAGLKDSGRLLPGHGGMLDRIDSVTAAAPLYALGLFGSGVLA